MLRLRSDDFTLISCKIRIFKLEDRLDSESPKTFNSQQTTFISLKMIIYKFRDFVLENFLEERKVAQNFCISALVISLAYD